MKDIWGISSKQLVLAIEEFGLPGGNSIDILAFSEDGDIAVIECKLADSSEVKRKVIGQILEYGASLWKNVTYEDLDERVRQQCGKSLADSIKELASNPGEWDEENFQKGVKKSLETGELILVIVVDGMNEELKQTIEFLNACGKPDFSFNALELALRINSRQ